VGLCRKTLGPATPEARGKSLHPHSVAARLLDDDDRLRDLPFFIVALMVHLALLSAPFARRAPRRPAAEPPAVEVDFVVAAPRAPEPPAPRPQPAPIRAEPPAPVRPAAVKPPRRVVARRKTSARPRPSPAAAKAALAAKAARNARAARVETERARHRAEASRALASIADPDEKLSDAVADAPKAPAAAAKLSVAAPAAPSADEALYDGDAAAKKPARPSRGGAGPVSLSLDGPAGDRKLVSRSVPESPAWLARRGLDASVQVKFEVEPDGRVRAGAVIKRTSGFPDVDRRALRAVESWRFAPLPAASKSAPSWGVATFRFLGA